MIRAVLFDLDGLLIDSESIWQEEERRVFNELDVPVTAAMQKETYGLGVNELVKYWYDYKPWGEKNFNEIAVEIYQSVTRRIENEGTIKKGVKEVIAFFRAKDVKMAVASSSPMMIIKAGLKKLEMDNTFEVIHSCEFEEYEKPHPAVYINTARKLGIEPVNCLVFEDSFVGLLAAKAARMKAVSVPDPDFAGDKKYGIADIKLSSLLDFNEEIFQQLNATK
jgi:sugar-phosphatase